MQSASLACALILATASLARAQYIWIEAEQPFATNFSARTNAFAPQNDAERDKLSGHAWIGFNGPRNGALFAVYDVDVPADGDYQFYVRKFWKHGPYRATFTNQPPIEVGADVALLDMVELRQNVCANWTSAGTVSLKKGKTRFRVESTTNDGAIAFDCFVLARDGFVPRGTLKPDERQMSTTTGWFAWDPPADRAGSPIDLRSLNEAHAGDDGRVVARDGRFVHETTGKPVRFWGVNLSGDIAKLDDAALDRLGAMLASRGVNLARIHGPMYATEGPNVGAIDYKQVANIQRAVAAMKRHGIYTTLSIYFPVWLKLDAAHGWAGYANGQPFGLLFFDPMLQGIYREWWRALLTGPGPNGVALKDEPAVLSLEMQNEDSLFFWTFAPYRNVPAPVMERIERRFATWLAARHGSAQAALNAWDSESIRGDDAANGRVGIVELWRLFNNRDARSKETARFLFEVQRDFYAGTRDYLRNDLGSVSMISASNWQTADDRYLLPLERASNLVGDFIDRHAYYNGVHESPRGWLVSTGDRYNDRSALRFEQEKPGDAGTNSWNPTFDTTIGGASALPTMVSEIDWLEPNRFRTEMPLLCATYGALQDVDAYAFFAVEGPTWTSTTSKYSMMTPASLGQFPAAALIFRLGLLDVGPTLVRGRVSLDDLLNLDGGLNGIDSKAHLVGGFDVRYGDGPTERPSGVDLSSLHDATAKVIRSATRQLSLDYGHGVLEINAAAAQGVVGFLDTRSETKLGDITIRSSMPYGAIVVVGLDGQPIATAPRLLVQVMSEQQNTGWQTVDAPTRTITSFGTGPLLVREMNGSIAFPEGSTWSAQPLDQNGQPLGDASIANTALTLEANVTHYVLTRNAK